MKLLGPMLLPILVMLTSVVYAQTVSPAFVAVRGYTEQPGTKKEVSNMPRIRSQGVFPICYAMAATTIVQRHICKQKSIANCARLEPKERENEISPLGLVAMTKVSSPDKPEDSFLSYRGLDLYDGGTAARALAVAADFYMFPKDSCFNFDRFSAKYGGNATTQSQIEEKRIEWDLAYAELKYVFEKNKSGKDSFSTKKCVDCKIVSNLLLTEIDQERLHSALKKDNFYEFLHRLIFNKCESEMFAQPVYRLFPEGRGRTNKLELQAKILEIIDRDLPLILGSICIIRGEKGDCIGEHAVVVSGYNKVCSKTECRILFKVHNSWGELWQSRNNNGWVDAESLLNNVNYNSAGKITWYE